MPGSIYVRLSGIVVTRWGDVLGPKKIIMFIFFSVLATYSYFISACVMTLSALRTVALRHIYLI